MNFGDPQASDNLLRIVIVEDNKTNLMILSRLASQVGDVVALPFEDPVAALAYVVEDACDLLIVDYLMPGLDGLEFIRRLRAGGASREAPVMMITSENDRALRKSAIEAGATDFITKPVEPIELKARARNLLALRRSALRERYRVEQLGTAVADATAVIAERERETVLRLARAIELRDGDTGQHVERLAALARDMARQLGLGDQAAEDLFLAAPMHDIGKLAVPDAILKKPGPLTPEERQIIQQHTIYGHAILDGSRSPLLRLAAAVALSHHERWDGAGYPHRLQGEAIPIEARIVAVADVYDALVNKRPYKEAWPPEKAQQYLRDNAGAQFDPACVEAFLSLQAHEAGAADREPALCGAA